jgi:pimeloyl-ACP methyl ester carboxylesterase
VRSSSWRSAPPSSRADEGSADPDWADPRAEALRIIDELPAGLGSVEVIDRAGHYPHRETPEAVVALLLPFLATTTSATHA